MTVGGRIYLKKDNSGLELVKAFAKIPTANIADTMGRSCAMHPRIKLFSSPHGTVWAGIALTVKSRGGDNLLIHAALDMAREGDVIVVSNEGGVDNRSLMGEIMFTYAAYKKLSIRWSDKGCKIRKGNTITYLCYRFYTRWSL